MMEHGEDEDSTTSPRRDGLRVHVRSATKDSLAVVWRGAGHYDQQSSTVVSGYEVRYQAVGSKVVQYSHRLQVGPISSSWPLVLESVQELIRR